MMLEYVPLLIMPFCQSGLDWWLAAHNHDDARPDGTLLLRRDVQVAT